MKTASTDKTDGMNTQDACCGSGCSCTGGSFGRVRIIICVLILVAATGLVARAIIKKNRAAVAPVPAASFTAPAVAQPAALAGSPAAPAALAATPAESAVTEIATLAELNTAAAKTDAVFVFLPGKSGTPPLAQMQAAAKTLGAQGRTVGIFTLKTTAPEYQSIAAQSPVPCVLAMVKGRGAAPVSGDITEAKLVQGFVAASSGGGGCGPASSGCGPAGCN
ncbi:MAG: hypothetical protein NTV22_16710 [bacterium]|nr:hypothetical protein [bacterium]